MGLFRRRQRQGRLRGAEPADERHLAEFARTRAGVEAYIEPRTAVTETTVVLVANTGEWTRRRVSSPRAAHELARKFGIPAYDAAVMGYPRRMREWNQQAQRNQQAQPDPGAQEGA